MKTSKFFKMSLLLLAASLVLIGCGDDDKEPEIVVDPVEETVEYYIEGKVTADNAALSGVNVTAGDITTTTDDNGQYSVTVKEKKTYTMSFTKDGYKSIDDATVQIAGNATNRSLATLNVTMNKEGEKVSVEPEKEIVVTEKGEDATDAVTAMTIPAGAVAEATEVSVTPYVETKAATETPGTKEAAISMTNIAITSSQDVTLNEDVTLSVANASPSNEYYFDEVEVYEKAPARAAGDWKKYADAVFDKMTNSYQTTIEKGNSLNKEFSVRVKSEKNVSATKNDEVLKEGSYSNAGNMSATTFEIPYIAKLGWEITVSGVDNATLSLVKSIIAAQEGGSEGVYTVNKTFTANVSGDYILYYSCKAKYVEKSYTFSISGRSVTVNVKHYLGVDFTYTNQSASMHGGGSIS